MKKINNIVCTIALCTSTLVSGMLQLTEFASLNKQINPQNYHTQNQSMIQQQENWEAKQEAMQDLEKKTHTCFKHIKKGQQTPARFILTTIIDEFKIAKIHGITAKMMAEFAYKKNEHASSIFFFYLGCYNKSIAATGKKIATHEKYDELLRNITNMYLQGRPRDISHFLYGKQENISYNLPAIMPEEVSNDYFEEAAFYYGIATNNHHERCHTLHKLITLTQHAKNKWGIMASSFGYFALNREETFTEKMAKLYRSNLYEYSKIQHLISILFHRIAQYPIDCPLPSPALYLCYSSAKELNLITQLPKRMKLMDESLIDFEKLYNQDTALRNMHDDSLTSKVKEYYPHVNQTEISQ